MSQILILTGSVFGAALQLTDDVAEKLESLGHTIERNETPTTSDLENGTFDWLLVITSTTGSGELPEDLVPMYNALRDTPPRVAGLRYAVVVLGDSSYSDDAMETSEPEETVLPWLQELADGGAI